MRSTRWLALCLALMHCAALMAQPQVEFLPPAATDARGIEHQLSVVLDPAGESLQVVDDIYLPSDWQGSTQIFALNSRLQISSSSLPVTALPASSEAGQIVGSTVAARAASTRYRVDIPANFTGPLSLSYAGVINELARQTGAEYARSFAATSGIISEDGVFLSGASMWVPQFDDSLVSFQLVTEFASGASDWSALSQGERLQVSGTDSAGQAAQLELWREPTPQEEIYLIAADFTVYSQPAGDIEALAYLRTPDRNLATRYLDATARYLELYEPLLGDYLYDKFALVENFWETGYGMPSFTLLGPQVIRFPFILETSYPHELLHNWWGNGVYPDYDSGNWSEGLTTYLADHLFREVDDRGPEYRKDNLARYKNYVSEDQDFPLSEFTARSSAATQAVGYGKTLMVWHMLRIELGDELFLEGLRRFYADFQFQRASWSDIEALFNDISGRDLSDFFAQWIGRSGAPELQVSVDEVAGNSARIMFAQIQPGDPYTLKVPMAFYYEGEEQPQIFEVELSQKLEGFMVEDYENLNAVLVDPYFDVFRLLDREETPPTIGELFGAREIAFVLPADNRQHWTRMAENFGQGADFDILFADQLQSLPADRSVWVLGRDNPFADIVAGAAADYGAAFGGSGISFTGETVEFTDRSSVLVGRHPANPDLAVGLIHIEDMIAIPGMIEKLPHYGRYSYLSFYGDEPTNDVQGIWTSPDSPLQWVNPNFDGNIDWAKLPQVPALAQLPARYRTQSLLSHAEVLTGPDMEGRGLGSIGLDRAADYLREQFRTAGLRPVGGSYQQRWRQSVDGLGEVPMMNVMGMIPGTRSELKGQPVIVGAHYDHLGIDENGVVYPGADDNASGLAVMLEVAKTLSRSLTPERPIIFVAFSGEESGLLGSGHFVANPPYGFSSENFYAMVNLDSVGRLEGRNLQVFGTGSAYEWPFMAQGIGFTIGLRSTFPAETIASSDHVSFLEAGIPAIHLFSGAHNDYSRPSDSAEKLDLEGMSNVALWLEEAVLYLSANVEPLRVTLDGAQPVQRSSQSGAREAFLGTVPDFAHSGEGVGITGVTPGSAAELAGLQAGDVLLSFDGAELSDLQTYSNLLRSKAPGDMVNIELRRDGALLTVEARLTAR